MVDDRKIDLGGIPGGRLRKLGHARKGTAPIRRWLWRGKPIGSLRSLRLAAFAAHKGEATEGSRDAGILVNATTLGMAGGGGELALDLAALNASCVVADLVYVPLLTPLLAAAKARGLTIVDGLGMLLHQAVPGFEKWFGVRPEVTPELRALLTADIEQRACS